MSATETIDAPCALCGCNHPEIDRWFRERYERTRDRLIDPAAYTKARMTREIILAVEAKRARGETVVIPPRDTDQPQPVTPSQP